MSIRFSLRAKMSILFLLFSGIISVSIALSFSEILRSRLLDELKSKLLTTVTLGAGSLDSAAIQRLLALTEGGLAPGQVASLEQSDDYHRLSGQLARIRATNPQIIRFVYTFIPTENPDMARYLVDADVLGLLSKRQKGEKVSDDDISHIGSDFDISEFAVARSAMASKRTGIDTTYVYDNAFRVNSISGYAPVLDEDGKLVAMLGLDMTDSDVREALAQVSFLSGIISALGLLVSLVLSILMGTLLTQNIKNLRKTVESFGQKDFSARSYIKARDEIGALADSFNLMAQTIVDYQDKISQVEREKAAAEFRGQMEAARNAENRKYLDNISQGLLLMDGERIISPHYSSFLVKLFHWQGSPAGMDFLDFVYPDASAHVQDRQELAEFISLLSSNVQADDAMLDSINPFKERLLMVRDGSTIVVTGHFLRVDKDDAGTSLMVVFEDKTSLVEAQHQYLAETARFATELESIAAILRNGPLLFRDFLGDSQSLLRDFATEQPMTLAADKIDHYFRQFHSLKGAARSLDLHTIAEEAHRIEDQLAGARDTDIIKASLNHLDGALTSIQTTVERFQAFSGNTQATGPTQDLAAFVKSLSAMTEDIGKELGKKIRLDTRIQVDQLPFLRELKNPLIHLIRNAIDHGIEDSYERVAFGKPETAVIVLDIRREGESLLVQVKDDGQGINFAAVRRSAIGKGLLAKDQEASDVDLLKLVFRPGFSSRDEISDLSGRGIGLDAVAQAIKDLGGAIRVSTKTGLGTTFRLRFPVA